MDRKRSLRILVADDNRATAFTFGKALEAHGHKVEVVLNGLAALDVARAFQPEVVLVDIGMPGIDGHEVTRRIRGERGFENILILVVSGRDGPDDVARSKAAGADDHLVKPIDFGRLWQTLERAGAGDAPDGGA